MKKLSSLVHKKLIAQAEEARELKMDSLADKVFNSIGPIARDDSESFAYSYADMENEVSDYLWKTAMTVISYYNSKNADIQKIDDSVQDLVIKVISELEESLDVQEKFGEFEPKVFGEK